jgi:hypothetical protein
MFCAEGKSGVVKIRTREKVQSCTRKSSYIMMTQNQFVISRIMYREVVSIAKINEVQLVISMEMLIVTTVQHVGCLLCQFIVHRNGYVEAAFKFVALHLENTIRFLDRPIIY